MTVERELIRMRGAGRVWRTGRARLTSGFSKVAGTELARGYAALGSVTAVSAISQIVGRLLIAGALGVVGLGNLAIVVGLAAVVQQFFDLRVGKFSILYGTEALSNGERERAGGVFKLSYILDGTTGLLGFGFILLSADWLTQSIARQPQLTDMLRLYAVVGVIGTLDGTSDAILKAAARYRAIAAFGTSMPLVELLLIGIALLLGGDLQAVIWALILKGTIGAVVHVALARRALQATDVRIMRAPLGLLGGSAREYAKLIFHTNFIGYSRLVLTKLDAIILGRYVALGEVGLYRLAVAAAAIVGLAAEPLRGTLLQLFARNLDKGRAAILSIVRRATVLGGGLVGLAGAALFLSGPAVFRLVVGPDAEGIKLVLAILIASQVALGVQVWGGPLVFAQKRPEIVGRVALGTLLVYPPLLVVGIRVGGLVGAALAFLAISAGTSVYLAIAALRGVEDRHSEEVRSSAELLREGSTAHR